MNQRASTDAAIDSVLRSLFLVLPVFRKKLMPDPTAMSGNFTPLHMAVLGMLSEKGQTATELARMMAVPKSQMTPAVARLVELELVERHVDAHDRRQVHLSLSVEGRARLERVRRTVEEQIRAKLSGLAPEDLERLSAAMDTLRDVVSRVQG